MNKKQLYESIMRSVSVEVKKALNESMNETGITTAMLSQVVFNIHHIFKELKDEARYWIDKLNKEYCEVEQIKQDANSIHIISERLKNIRIALNDTVNYSTYTNDYDNYVEKVKYIDRNIAVDKENYSEICRLYLNLMNDQNVLGYNEIPVFTQINEIIDLIKYLESTLKDGIPNINGVCRRLNTIIKKFNQIRLPIIDASEILDKINNK